MDTAPGNHPPTYDPALLAALRAENDSLRARLHDLKTPNPWLVVTAGLLTGILLAAAVITAAYLTPPLPH